MLKMPKNLHQALKIYSVIHNVTMTAFIIEAVKEKLKTENSKTKGD